jgi:4-hydroxy 2-oxovalerate aldolase
MLILDCTLRDGGYYNNWDFPRNVVQAYLEAMVAAGINIVEIGLRSLIDNGFKGAHAFSSESYLQSLMIPSELKIAVMVNASELICDDCYENVLNKLFPMECSDSVIDVVRIACHVHEFESALPASKWLSNKGYKVAFNLMQIADRCQHEIEAIAMSAGKFPIDVLYFADSMGSMTPDDTKRIIEWLRTYWSGDIGIHTHDNMGLALQNTLCALRNGVHWLDSTVTGMGRGPGNAKTEELAIEIADMKQCRINLVPLMTIIRKYFQPQKNICGWGTNPYYYLSGKYGIHPTYVQEMLGDSRYSEEDILAAINHLKIEGGKRFSLSALDATRNFYIGDVSGSWRASELLNDREVLILGAGHGVELHNIAIEDYIKRERPFVIALNTQSAVKQSLIDVRVACHPVRLLADCAAHKKLPQPLITPVSKLPIDILESLSGKVMYDFGLSIQSDTFVFNEHGAILPSSLVICYALAIVTSGKSKRIRLAGFDGYGSDDPRTKEMQHVFDLYMNSVPLAEIISITPTSYNIPVRSVYAL